MTEASPLIYNPRAGGGRAARTAERARDLLAARGIHVEPVPTGGPGGARPLAERLASEGAARLFVMGGDGTLGEAADGVLRSGKSPTLGFLPGGTGNDFLLDFGLRTLDEAVDRIAAAKPRDLDAGLIETAAGKRHFIGVFGIGFMAHVTDLANRRFKRLGSRAYTAAVFPELVRLHAPQTRLVLDGEVIEGRFPMVAVCNTVHAGGSMKFAPNARTDDGLLDVVACRDVGRLGLLRLFPRIFSGAHVDHPQVLHAQARRVTLEPERPGPLLADGEVFGTTPCTVSVLPAALRLLL